MCIRDRQYADSPRPALREVDLSVGEGELVLVIGATGSGKSTLLGTLNGLVPHFTGGTLTGSVTVGGRDTRTHRPRDLADLVGTVRQSPAGSFVTDVVEDELAFGTVSYTHLDVYKRQFRDPTTIMRSHRGAICLTASWRFWVA